MQEEVGLRGARVAAFAFDPDMAIAIDSTPANDLPMWDDTENTSYNTRLGEGPALYVADRATMADPRIVRFLLETSEKHGIPMQVRQPGGGAAPTPAPFTWRAGGRAQRIHLVPGRYAHTAVAIARLDDWKNTVALLHTA